MAKRKDLTNQQFGYLTALERMPGSGRSKWRCQCVCGRETIVLATNLRTKGRGTTSCGCRGTALLNVDKMPEYASWRCMKRRCDNPSASDYPRYGGRGISYQPSWKDFKEFYEDMGPSDGLTLERIDVNGSYTKDNCRWATRKEQSHNRRNSLKVTIKGETKLLKEWCEHYSVKYGIVLSRLSKGMSPLEALTTISRKHEGNPKPVTINGVTEELLQWIDHYEISQSTYYKRLKKGWSQIAAITTPKGSKEPMDSAPARVI